MFFRTWFGTPVREHHVAFKWIAVALLIFILFMLLYVVLWAGRFSRRKRWQRWAWPSFEDFVIEECRSQMWGSLQFGSVILLFFVFLGWAVR